MRGQRSVSVLESIFGIGCNIESRSGPGRDIADYFRLSQWTIPGTLFEFGRLSVQGRRVDLELQRCFEWIVAGREDRDIAEAFPACRSGLQVLRLADLVCQFYEDRESMLHFLGTMRNALELVDTTSVYIQLSGLVEYLSSFYIVAGGGRMGRPDVLSYLKGPEKACLCRIKRNRRNTLYIARAYTIHMKQILKHTQSFEKTGFSKNRETCLSVSNFIGLFKGRRHLIGDSQVSCSQVTGNTNGHFPRCSNMGAL